MESASKTLVVPHCSNLEEGKRLPPPDFSESVKCRFSESAICSSRVHPPSEIKSNFKFKTLRWRPLRWRLTLSELSVLVRKRPVLLTVKCKPCFSQRPQNPRSGWAGKFQEIQGLCRISTETLGPGNSGKIILGTPFLAIWGDFLGEMRMAQVDMLGRGDTLVIVL